MEENQMRSQESVTVLPDAGTLKPTRQSPAACVPDRPVLAPRSSRRRRAGQLPGLPFVGPVPARADGSDERSTNAAGCPPELLAQAPRERADDEVVRVFDQ